MNNGSVEHQTEERHLTPSQKLSWPFYLRAIADAKAEADVFVQACATELGIKGPPPWTWIGAEMKFVRTSPLATEGVKHD